MRTLKFDSNTSIRDLAEFVKEAGKTDLIRSKKENEQTVLYLAKPNLLGWLKEKFIPKYAQRIMNRTDAAKNAITTIVLRSGTGGEIDTARKKISGQLIPGHAIIASSIRTDINTIDELQPVFRAERENTHWAWHACVDELMRNHDCTQDEGMEKLKAIRNLTSEQSLTMASLLMKNDPTFKLGDKGQMQFSYLMLAQSHAQQSAAVSIDYSAIHEFAKKADAALTNLTVREPDNPLLKKFEHEPLKTAMVFLRCLSKPGELPAGIEMSDPARKPKQKDWHTILFGSKELPDNPSERKEELKEIAQGFLDDRDHFPNKKVYFFLPEGVTQAAMRTAFLDAYNERRNVSLP